MDIQKHEQLIADGYPVTALSGYWDDLLSIEKQIVVSEAENAVGSDSRSSEWMSGRSLWFLIYNYPLPLVQAILDILFYLMLSEEGEVEVVNQ